MGVGVVVDALVLHASGDVHVREALQRHGPGLLEGVPAVVARVRVDVGDVEQQHRIGAFDDLGDELRLGQLVLGPREDGRDGFEGDRDVELGLHALDVGDHDVDRLPRARQRQEVSCLDASGAHERDVLADERRPRDAGRVGEVGDAVRVESFGVAEAEAHAVRDDGDTVVTQPTQGRWHTVHDALGDDLDPAQVRQPREQGRDLLTPADADAGGHGQARGGRRRRHDEHPPPQEEPPPQLLELHDPELHEPPEPQVLPPLHHASWLPSLPDDDEQE